MKLGFPLLKPGTYRDRHNQEVTITRDDIESIALSYGTGGKAPLTVGHPDKTKVPSFGVVDALKVVGDTLYFKPARMVAEFAKLVDQQMFPGLSAGLFKQQDGWRLGHVAFLSAQKPAVPLDGLPMVEFSASASAEASLVSIDVTAPAQQLVQGALEFAGAAESWLAMNMRQLGRVLRNLKNRTIETDGMEAANELIPEYIIDDLATDLPREAETAAQFSSHPTGGSVDFEKLYNEQKARADALEQKNAELSASVESLTGKVTEMAAAGRRAEFSAFVEGLIAEGKMLPDQKVSEIERMETLHNAVPAEFSAADGKKTPLEQYKEDLQRRPVVAPGGNEILGAAEFGAACGDTKDPYEEEGSAIAASLEQ
jgi:hypothetical protein